MNHRTNLILLLTASAIAINAAVDDNVVIKSGKESYTIATEKNRPVVKTTLSHEYEATRKSATIHPHIFYNDVITLDKASGGKAQYRNANNPAVFHDDSKVCYFDIALGAKGKKASVEFKRTITDPAFFTKVFLADDYPIQEKTVTFHLPPDMPGIKLIDRNIDNSTVTRSETTASDGSRTITYNIHNLPPIEEDKTGMPSPMRYQPHVLITGYFPDVDSLFRWHHNMLVVDTTLPDADKFMDNVLADADTDSAKISAIYSWVQDNIRYVAYEEGDAGFRPDTPAEVIRKRYGDCKGMAVLLSEMLRHEGFEAWPASIGTDDIPFLIKEYPTLAATNHMICVLYHNSDTIFLDATNNYIPYSHVPSAIQGKDAIVDKGTEYDLVTLPVLPASASTDSLSYSYTFSNGYLTGKARRSLTGDVKEYFMSQLDAIKKPYQADALMKSLLPSTQASVQEVSTDSSGAPAIITGTITNTMAVTEAGNRLYVDLNTYNDPFSDRIDAHERTTDYSFPFHARIVRESSLLLPEGASVTCLPDNFSVTDSQGSMSCTFAADGRTVKMTKILQLDNPVIAIDEIDRWNNKTSDWNNSCNQQIEITLK